MSVKLRFVALALGLLILAAVSLVSGGSAIGVSELLAVIQNNATDSARTIILEIRLPRILLAMLVGAGIATAGAAIQGLFRNPLADPALIGVSAGSALFAALFMLLGAELPWHAGANWQCFPGWALSHLDCPAC